MGVINFIKENHHKSITIKAYVYSAVFRMKILFRKPDKLRRKWGIEGKESESDVDRESYIYARGVSLSVNRVCNKTAWESKCLVRALTAQKLLKEKHISSTLYLGCGYQDGKMVAHAWLRCGRMYVTGGDGSEYSVVDKFCVD